MTSVATFSAKQAEQAFQKTLELLGIEGDSCRVVILDPEPQPPRLPREGRSVLWDDHNPSILYSNVERKGNKDIFDQAKAIWINRDTDPPNGITSGGIRMKSLPAEAAMDYGRNAVVVFAGSKDDKVVAELILALLVSFRVFEAF